MCGKRVAQRVRAGWLENAAFEARLFKQYRLMKVMPVFFSADSVDIVTGRRKHPLRAPFLAGVRIFAFERIR